MSLRLIYTNNTTFFPGQFSAQTIVLPIIKLPPQNPTKEVSDVTTGPPDITPAPDAGVQTVQGTVCPFFNIAAHIPNTTILR